MKQLFFLAVFACFTLTATAQQYTAKGESDPEAKAILNKIKKKYEAYTSIEADFTLTIEFPEEPKEVQKGKLKQRGEKYRVELATQSVISNGETLWLWLKDNKDVQINDVEEMGEDGLSPTDLLRIYEKEDYVYILANEFTEKGIGVQQIEFKPLDEDNEYSKLRLTVAKKSGKILRVKVFGKDGSKFTLAIENLASDVALGDSVFEWSKKECPDCHVEDLRF